MEQVTAYKTVDGKFFETKEVAEIYEKELHSIKILKLKENYVRERLKESVYGKLFINEFEPRKSNITPDKPLVHVLIQNTDLVKEIINNLENIN